MSQRFDSTHKVVPRHAEPGWLEPSDRLTQAAAVLGAAKSFHETHCRHARRSIGVNSELDDRFHKTVELYEGGEWSDAFFAAVSLAESGHAAAAHLALLMLRYGTPLYGTTLRSEPRQVARWAKLVLRAKATRLGDTGAVSGSHRSTSQRSVSAVS